MQLPLVCATPNKRPRCVTPAMAWEAANTIAQELIKSDPAWGKPDEIITDILDVTVGDYTMDGYQIARALERCKYWECDLALAKMMDDFGNHCHELLRAAERQWGNENPMTPPHAPGTTVQTPRGTGVIEEVFTHAPNSFLVLINDKHLIIPFEDTNRL